MNKPLEKKQARIDTHIHLAVTGCQCHGGWLHPGFRRGSVMRVLKWMHGISNRDLNTRFDTLWRQMISKMIAESVVDYGVVLGFDGVAGPKGQIDKDRSQLIVPVEWVFENCRQYSNLLPGPSVNPHREDALDLLDECIDKKAVLIKWLPSVQRIEVSSSKLKAFYTKLAGSKIPLLIHIGGEVTFKSLEPGLNDIELIRYPLDLGMKVICAHSATKVLGSKEPDFESKLIEMLEAYPHLWVDNSGLCNLSRFHHVPALAKNKSITERMLYGSDWPVPSNAWYFLKDMGLKKVLEIEGENNRLNRDILIKEFYGYPENTYTNAHKVLANLDYWLSR